MGCLLLLTQGPLAQDCTVCYDQEVLVHREDYRTTGGFCRVVPVGNIRGIISNKTFGYKKDAVCSEVENREQGGRVGNTWV